jgi:hypothetical protein
MSLVHCPRCGCTTQVSWGTASEVVGDCCVACGCEDISETSFGAFDRPAVDVVPERGTVIERPLGI